MNEIIDVCKQFIHIKDQLDALQWCERSLLKHELSVVRNSFLSLNNVMKHENKNLFLSGVIEDLSAIIHSAVH